MTGHRVKTEYREVKVNRATAEHRVDRFPVPSVPAVSPGLTAFRALKVSAVLRDRPAHLAILWTVSGASPDATARKVTRVLMDRGDMTEFQAFPDRKVSALT